MLHNKIQIKGWLKMFKFSMVDSEDRKTLVLTQIDQFMHTNIKNKVK